MRHSSQCEIGSRAWRKVKCHEGDCQGAVTDNHSVRAEAVSKAYPTIDGEFLTLLVLSGRCGPECSK